jgi:hypothetical protein
MKTLRRSRVLKKIKRTRKHKIHGGMYICDISNKKTMNDCINDYIKENNFTKVETADDGNCFFDTLSKFYELNGIEKSHSELREELITYIDKNKVKIKQYHDGNEKSFNKAVDELSILGAWCSNLGDSVPSIAATAFNIKIIIHDVRQKNKVIPRNINRIELDPGGNPKYTVNMLRNKNHYELLIESNSEMHNLLEALTLSKLNK